MKPSTPSSPATRAVPPDRRFVRLRHAGQREGVTTTMTFLAADGNASAATDNGVLADIAARDPRRAELIRAGMRQLIGRDDAVMRWLEADPANTALFTTDPVTALHRALPDLPADFFDGWR